MKQMRFSTVVFLLFPFFVSAQTVVNGSVKNKKGEPLSVNVMVQAKGSFAIAGFTTIDAQGNYSLIYKGTADSITLTASGVNIGKHSQTVANRSQRVDFVIDEKALELKEVVVIPIKIKQTGDTINYSVNAYTDQNDRVIGDVLKKLPGIDVKLSGGITYNGRDINKFYVEDMDLLQGRYGIAIKNIAAKDVATVQVLENHQPIKALRNKLPSADAAINLKLKESAKGTLAITGLAGAGYEPLMWNAELVSMYFAKKKQNMSTYKSNNSGDDVASEFKTHYDYERVYVGGGSPLYIQSPSTPPVAQKRYLYNNSHAVTTNHLIKFSEDSELTTSAIYYNDRIEREGYSRHEQYLPGDSTLAIEERINSKSKIHNAEIALRLNTNAGDYYLNNALNLTGSWNDDSGLGNTRSNAGDLNETISQHLDKPAFSIDNTLSVIKNIKDNSVKIYFSTGYWHRPHTLTVTPANYLGDGNFSALAQDVLSRDFASVLRLSYGLKLGYFNLDYDVWGRADLRNMNTELHGEDVNGNLIVAHDSLKNNLWYNNYQAGITQSYSYNNGRFKARIGLPLTCYILTIDDRIPKVFTKYNKWIINPSISASYDFNSEIIVSTEAHFGRSFGDMNSAYSGFIMHGYRSLLRNTVDRLFESRSGGAEASVRYRNVFEALFLNVGVTYNRSWKNLLYGFDYQGIMNVKTTIDQPTESENYGVSFNASKGLGFWSATVRTSGGYNEGRGELLIQDEILNYRSQGYNAGAGASFNPVSFLGFSYSFAWNRSKSYTVERPERFPPIVGTSQTAQINIFPFKALTININAEHQYNSAASTSYTTFADAGIKYKQKTLDLELALNNLFNAKQYISASYSDISTYYYSYNLRPASVLLKARFKLK
ncbi:TonB-dependent receptor [Bacteroidia bacterium]|nr:TonB-dependent receptor [Bacteroidia bacterium]